jgi:hypothetical protein
MCNLQKLVVAVLAAALLAACTSPEETALRVRPDAERNLLWTLDLQGVAIYNNTSGRLVQRVELPGWVVAGRQFGCPPDLVVDSSGAAIVSSNVLPVLWRIEPMRFEVSMLTLALDTDQDKDVGFSGLTFARDGALLAVGSSFGSLWRIDLRAASAAKLRSFAPVRGACEAAAVLGM